MTHRFNQLLKWALPALLLLLLAPYTPTIDMALSEKFFDSTRFSSHPYYLFFYRYGAYPALMLTFGALGLCMISFLKKKNNRWIKPALFILVSMCIGNLLIIHFGCKGFLVRPRPVQTLPFGGAEIFKPFYRFSLALPNRFKSFPSGHAAIGFFFINLVILGQRLKNKKILLFGLLMTLFMGLSLSVSRIAQGGHFFSDTLVSLYVMWYAGLASDWLVFDFLAKKTKLRYIED